MLNNEWQDFLCGLMPEEHTAEPEQSDAEVQENTEDMPELRGAGQRYRQGAYGNSR